MLVWAHNSVSFSYNDSHGIFSNPINHYVKPLSFLFQKAITPSVSHPHHQNCQELWMVWDFHFLATRLTRHRFKGSDSKKKKKWLLGQKILFTIAVIRVSDFCFVLLKKNLLVQWYLLKNGKEYFKQDHSSWYSYCCSGVLQWRDLGLHSNITKGSENL